MSTAHRPSSSHSVAAAVVAPKRRRSSALHAITAAVEPLERRLCLSAASLTPLGNLPGDLSSTANAVSGDGSVVVGTSGGYGGQAFRWTAAGGMVGLGRPPGDFYSYARGVSGDGSVVVGGSDYSFDDYYRIRASRWTAAGGMQGLGHLPGGGFQSIAVGVSANGSVIVGASDSASGYQAFRWTAAGGMQGLGDLPGGSFDSEASGVSGDGSVIVGYGTSASASQAFRWTSAAGMVGLGLLPGDLYSGAFGVSADGSIVVGTSSSGSIVHVFRWTSADGMVGLGNLPGGFSPFGFSADGSVVVGYEAIDLFPPHYKALYWTPEGGTRDLWDVLLSQGVDPAADGWSRLEFAKAVSADGNTIVGDGIRNGNSEAFVATLAAPDIVASAFQFNDLPHRIVTTFDQNVSASLGTDDLLIENLTTQQTIPSSDFALAYDAATDTATFSYAGNAGGITGVLPDGDYRATLLAAGISGPGGTPMAQDHILNFFFLNGDANRDARVNLQDFNVLAANFGQGNRTFSQGDFNYDGTVNLADFNILAARFGQALAAVPFAKSPFAEARDGDERRDLLEELT